MHHDNVFVAAADSRGARLVTGSASGEVIVWQVAPFGVEAALRPAGGGKVLAIAVAPVGDHVAWAIDWKPEVVVASGPKLATRTTIVAHSGRVTALAFAPSGGVLAVAGAERAPSSGGGADEDDAVPKMLAPTVRLFDRFDADTPVRELSGLTGRVTALAFSADGAQVAAGGGGKVMIWDTASGGVVTSLDVAGDIATIHLSHSQAGMDVVCVVTSEAALCVNGKQRRELPGVQAPTLAAAFQGDFVISAGYDATELRRRDGTGAVVSVPGRAYAIVPVADMTWVVQVDRAIVTRGGKATGELHMLRAPEERP